ncbi:MAG: DUF3786 domain-containing protein [Deltaproteobacteria bacterium]|nr:DUF3786 domain-containing protein [Deltaproteobacteria bacterium]
MQRKSKSELIKVPPKHWEDLKKMDMNRVCEYSLAISHDSGGFRILFLNNDILVDIESRCLRRIYPDRSEKIDNSLLELVVLVYLLNVTHDLISREMISVSDLKDAHFFQGPHTLKTAPVLKRYGGDLTGFKNAAESLDGEFLDLADAAYKFSPFPKIPLYYLLWEGDDEFEPHLSVLFDRSIERHLSADAIWGLVNLVSNELLMAGQSR